MKKLLVLWNVLWRREDSAQDERTREEIRSTWLLVSGAGCLLLLGSVLYYLIKEDVNRSQLAAGMTGIVAMLAGGLGLGFSFRGVLGVADRWGGRLVVLAGILSMAVHWSMLVPVRQYFKGTWLLIDVFVLGAIVFYLLCNGACCAYETLWQVKAAAQEQEEEMDGRRMEQLAQNSFRKKQVLCWILFLAAVLLPAWLQYAVFSDRVMEQAKEQQAQLEAAARTPEYKEMEALCEKWQQQMEKDGVSVYRGSLQPKFFPEENPSYEDAGCLWLKTDEMQMRIGFAGEEVVQSEYCLSEEEDPQRATFLYHGGKWEQLEDIEAEWHRENPAYPVGLGDYELEAMTGWNVEISPLWMKGNVEVSSRDGNTVYRYVYSDAYVKELTRDLDQDGHSSWRVVQALEMTADANGNPVACTWEFCCKSADEEQLKTERLMGQLLPGLDAAALQEEMQESGPFVPEEARQIWENAVLSSPEAIRLL